MLCQWHKTLFELCVYFFLPVEGAGIPHDIKQSDKATANFVNCLVCKILIIKIKILHERKRLLHTVSTLKEKLPIFNLLTSCNS